MPNITVQAQDGGSFNAYISMPEVTPAPAVIVIQEIFGVNDGLREKCDWLAHEGFIAVCPDLFWRIEPGIELTDKTQEEWDRAFELFNSFNIDLGIDDLIATENSLREHADVSDKIGCMGYCLGGKLSYLMACRSDMDASVSYYGVGLDQLLEEANNIAGPLLIHIAEEDEYVPKEAQTEIKQALESNEAVTIHSYEGVDHAFSRHNGQHYNEEAAKLADSRTIEFLKNSLLQSATKAA